MAKEDQALVPQDEAQLYELFTQALERKVDIAQVYDSEAVQLALAKGILAAEDEDQVFGDASLPAWSDLLDKPVTLFGVHFNPSQVENGPGIYAVVDVADQESGERRTRHIGGYRPVAQLLWLWYRKRFPYHCVLTEVAKAKAGQSAPLGIKRLTAPAK